MLFALELSHYENIDDDVVRAGAVRTGSSLRYLLSNRAHKRCFDRS